MLVSAWISWNFGNVPVGEVGHFFDFKFSKANNSLTNTVIA
jgi:hypothetical protein